jgi:hypothetical protein
LEPVGESKQILAVTTADLDGKLPWHRRLPEVLKSCLDLVEHLVAVPPADLTGDPLVSSRKPPLGP